MRRNRKDDAETATGRKPAGFARILLHMVWLPPPITDQDDTFNASLSTQSLMKWSDIFDGRGPFEGKWQYDAADQPERIMSGQDGRQFWSSPTNTIFNNTIWKFLQRQIEIF